MIFYIGYIYALTKVYNNTVCVWAGLVRQRHYRLAHGVGRSGDLAENQPKAAGSSLMYTLTNAIVLDLVRHMGEWLWW